MIVPLVPPYRVGVGKTGCCLMPRSIFRPAFHRGSPLTACAPLLVVPGLAVSLAALAREACAFVCYYTALKRRRLFARCSQ